jgi:hypothetical protein
MLRRPVHDAMRAFGWTICALASVCLLYREVVVGYPGQWGSLTIWPRWGSVPRSTTILQMAWGGKK